MSREASLDGVAGPGQEIAALEDGLDALETSAERCRRTAQLGRMAAAAGAAFLPVAFWRSDATLLVSGIAALLGGLAFAGSTGATRRKVVERIEAVEARRSEIIDGLGVPARMPQEGGGVVAPFRR